jgi:hypothetical protein
MFETLGIIKLIIIVLALIVGAYVFMFNRASKAKFDKDKEVNNAPVLLTGSGSFLGPQERTGGRLVLTTKELLLFPHKINLVQSTIRLSLKDAKSARAYNTWKFYPTGLAVQTKDNELRYWVYSNKKWAKLINEQIKKSKMT